MGNAEVAEGSGRPERFGRYELESHLARGGMADVYLAHLPGPEGVSRQLVLKRIRPELAGNRDFVEMFLDEARVASRLAHPHIVQVFEFGREREDYFLTMEYIRGPSLRRLVEATKRAGLAVPYRLLAKIGAWVAEGLEYAHNQKDDWGRPLNIVHRDISATNILVSLEGAVKIVDFGIAKVADSTHETRAGMVKGKQGYMSEEQLLRKRIDGRSDIYSLGVTLYYAVTGRLPFEDVTGSELLRRVGNGVFEPPRRLRPDLPPELQAIIMKAMAPGLDERYSRAREMCGHLERFCSAGGRSVSTFEIADYLGEVQARFGESLVHAPSSRAAGGSGPRTRPVPPIRSVPRPARGAEGQGHGLALRNPADSLWNATTIEDSACGETGPGTPERVDGSVRPAAADSASKPRAETSSKARQGKRDSLWDASTVETGSQRASPRGRNAVITIGVALLILTILFVIFVVPRL